MADKAPDHEQQGYDLMGAAFEVYNEIGPGHVEEIYQECLEKELSLRNIPFTAQEQLTVYYKGEPLKKRFIPDLFVFNTLVVELKAAKTLLPDHEAQLLNYLRITHRPVGYLINFGHPTKLEWKRLILT